MSQVCRCVVFVWRILPEEPQTFLDLWSNLSDRWLSVRNHLLPQPPREAINHLIAKSYLNTVYEPIYPFDIKATKQDLQPFTFQTEKCKLLRNTLQLLNTIKAVSTRIKRAVICVLNCIQKSEQDKLLENNLTINEKWIFCSGLL